MRRLRKLLTRWAARFLPDVSRAMAVARETRAAQELLNIAAARDQAADRALWRDYVERCAELVEAKQMAGAGPWLVAESRQSIDGATRIRESNPLASQGAFGDIELALQNVEWRREVNLSWLEFSRWGIQQIILISRLYYIKNPIIRRLIDISAQYVFGRGVEVTSTDEVANETLKDFFARNRKTLGQIALTKHERRKYYDGNLFFALFPDKVNTGSVECRMIDATEIQDIVCDPDDSEKPRFYRRSWSQRQFDEQTGVTISTTTEAWCPAINYEPDSKPEKINGIPVFWDSVVHHRKCGEVAQWSFGCPMIYPALDWAKAGRRFLEACLTVRQALATISMTLTTKGGQQALAGAKQQLQTTVSATGGSLWDTNPPPVSGSVFASGPGTTLSAFQTKGAGGDPEEVRQYKLMCAMVVGVPETFLSDVSTGNLATATTLDRPTELCFLEKQEAWREDLLVIAEYVLKTSARAPSGQLRESVGDRHVRILEAPRRYLPNGDWVYESAKDPTPGVIEIRVNFPNIVEGDVPALVKATTEAMTLGNTKGEVHGIDERAGVRLLYDQLGVENGDKLIEESYPETEYDPDRTAEPEPLPPAPIPIAQPRSA